MLHIDLSVSECVWHKGRIYSNQLDWALLLNDLGNSLILEHIEFNIIPKIIH